MEENTILPVVPTATGGGLEGAQRMSREMLSWVPPLSSPDQQINPNKETADSRGRDSVQNDGYAMGAVYTHRDSIVGSQYRLNAHPVIEVLEADDKWSEEFQEIVEARFNLIADSSDNWLDASGMNTLTGLIRLAIGGFLYTGEVLATSEWLKDSIRPVHTAIQMVSPSRLSNPDNMPDTRFLRRGVERNKFGQPKAYFIRSGHPGEIYDESNWTWKRIAARKPFGRRQVIHIVEQLQPDQTRGVADMVATLKQSRMTKRFQDITLQNAVVNATYAAAIESELPREVVFGSMGVGQNGFGEMLHQYMSALSSYVGGSENIAIDGVKMPHLFPGTKLSLKPMGTPGGVGTDFEKSLLRHIAASLGLSYEQFSRDYTNTNYSSARASMSETWKFMQSRKKNVADKMATMIYALWMEEEINAGNIPLPPGKDASIFYDPIMREALLSCSWIGASRGQIDELKETQSALLRINGTLSTYETECARLGEDFRKVIKQRARENRMMKELGLTSDLSTEKPSASNTVEKEEE